MGGKVVIPRNARGDAAGREGRTGRHDEGRRQDHAEGEHDRVRRHAATTSSRTTSSSKGKGEGKKTARKVGGGAGLGASDRRHRRRRHRRGDRRRRRSRDRRDRLEPGHRAPAASGRDAACSSRSPPPSPSVRDPSWRDRRSTRPAPRRSTPAQTSRHSRSTWKAPEAAGVRFAGKKVAALVISSDMNLRVSGEEQLVAAIAKARCRGRRHLPPRAGRGTDDCRARAAVDRARRRRRGRGAPSAQRRHAGHPLAGRMGDQLVLLDVVGLLRLRLERRLHARQHPARHHHRCRDADLQPAPRQAAVGGRQHDDESGERHRRS